MIELELKKHVADKTNWRKMLSSSPPKLNLKNEKKRYLNYIPNEFKQFIIADDNVTEITYPVFQYPQKVKSLSFQKNTLIEGTLLGIKGQYLIFDNNRVFNVRAHERYEINALF